MEPKFILKYLLIFTLFSFTILEESICDQESLTDNIIIAQEWYEKALSLGKNGDLLHCQDPKRALLYIDIAIEKDPNFARAYSGKGLVLINLKEYDQALINFNKAIEIDPASSNFFSNRSVAYFSLKKIDYAIKDCDTAIKLDPNNKSAYHNRGVIYFQMGMKVFACKEFEKECELGNCQPYENVKDKGLCTIEVEVDSLPGASDSQLKKICEDACSEKFINGTTSYIDCVFCCTNDCK